MLKYQTSRPRCIATAILALSCALVPFPQAPGQEEDDNGGAPSVDAAPKQLPVEITELFPVGRTFLGVRIPSYSGDDLESIMTADEMTRLNDRELEMTNLVITIYNAQVEPESVVTTDLAIYDLVSERLTSRTKAFIKGESIDIVGDQLIYDAATRQPRLTKVDERVRTIVKNVKDFAPPKPGDQGKAPSEPAGNPNPDTTP